MLQNTIAFRPFNPIRAWNESMEEHGQWAEVSKEEWAVFRKIAPKFDIRFIELDDDEDYAFNKASEISK